MSDPRFVAYETGGASEWMLARGPRDGPQLLMLQPLFEEMNRCRAVLAEVQRRLADIGIGSWLFDLPGTGESERAITAMSLEDWRNAVSDAAMASGAGAVASFRGGCVLDRDVELPRWRLSPIDGAAALRDLARATGETRVPAWPLAPPFEIALATARVEGEARVARLASDSAQADTRLDGSPPWRRAEPASDAPLAEAIAADLATWLER